MSDSDWDFSGSTSAETMAERPDFDAFEYESTPAEVRVIPDGSVVNATVVEAGEKTDKDHNRIIEIKLQVADGDYAGCKLWKNFKCWSHDEDEKKKQRAAYQKFLTACEFDSVPAYSQLVGRSCRPKVGVYTTAAGKTRNSVRWFENA